LASRLPRLFPPSNRFVSAHSRTPGRRYDRAVRFSFAKSELPLSLRVCRSLVWTQAAFVILGGVFVLFVATVFGAGSAVPFHGDALSGSRAATLGLVYVVAGLALAFLGVALGRVSWWARIVIVSLEVFLTVLLFFRSFDLSVSMVINVGLVAGIVGLLFTAETRRAFERRPAPVAASEAQAGR
jgi:hypothetical protein